MRLRIAATLAIFAAPPVLHAQFLEGPYTRPGEEMPRYYLINQPMSWTDARDTARNLGGRLVTINDAAENAWVWETFWPLVNRARLGFWIGLTNAGITGNWRWDSGEPVTYTNWRQGNTCCGINEPNNCGGDEHFAHMLSDLACGSVLQPGTWNDAPDGSGEYNLPAVIEVECLSTPTPPSREWDRLLPTTGAWSDSGNWKNSVVPGQFDAARFNSASSVTSSVTLARVAQTRIDRGTVTLVSGMPPELQGLGALEILTPVSELCDDPNSLIVIGSQVSPALLSLLGDKVTFDRSATIGYGESADATVEVGPSAILRGEENSFLILADSPSALAHLQIRGTVNTEGRVIVGQRGGADVVFPANGPRMLEARSLLLGEHALSHGRVNASGTVRADETVIGKGGTGELWSSSDGHLTTKSLRVGDGPGGTGTLSTLEGFTLDLLGAADAPGRDDFLIVGNQGVGTFRFRGSCDLGTMSHGRFAIGDGTVDHPGLGTVNFGFESTISNRTLFHAPNLRVQSANVLGARATMTLDHTDATFWSLETGVGDSDIKVQESSELTLRGNTLFGQAVGANVALDVGNLDETAQLWINGSVRADGVRVGGWHAGGFGGNAALLVRGNGSLQADYWDGETNSFNGGRFIVAGGSSLNPARAEVRDAGRVEAEKVFVGYDLNTTPQSGELVIDGPFAKVFADRSVQIGFRFKQDDDLQSSLLLFGNARVFTERFTKGSNASLIGGTGPNGETRIKILKPSPRADARDSLVRREDVDADIQCATFEFFGNDVPSAIILDLQPTGTITGEGAFPYPLPFVNPGTIAPIVQPPDMYQSIEYTIDFPSNYAQASTGVLHLDYYFNNNDSFDFARGAITVAGTATLGGTLHLNYAGFCCGWSGPEMYIGRRVDAVRAQSVLGRFDKIEVAPSFRGVRARVEYTPTAAEVVFLPPCAGDLNSDDQVDDTDFQSFLLGYNILDCADAAMPAGCPADLNRDGLVDDADFPVFVVAYNELLCP